MWLDVLKSDQSWLVIKKKPSSIPCIILDPSPSIRTIAGSETLFSRAGAAGRFGVGSACQWSPTPKSDPSRVSRDQQMRWFPDVMGAPIRRLSTDPV